MFIFLVNMQSENRKLFSVYNKEGGWVGVSLIFLEPFSRRVFSFWSFCTSSWFFFKVAAEAKGLSQKQQCGCLMWRRRRRKRRASKQVGKNLLPCSPWLVPFDWWWDRWIIALCSYPHVKVEIRDSSQISTTAPIFLQLNYFRQKYLEIASCSDSLLIYIWVRVDHSLLQQ